MSTMTPLTEVMEDLRTKGYTHDFNPKNEYLIEESTDTKVKSDEFDVDKFYRFEGTSDPGDEMTLYAITTKDGKKGVFVSPQGTYSGEVSPELMAKFDLWDKSKINTDGAVKPLENPGV